MHRFTKFAVGLVLAVSAVSSFAAQGRWTEGFGQGNLEYFIDQDGFRLVIGCPTQDGSIDGKSGVSLQELSTNRDVPKFTLTAAGITFDGPFDADSRVGDNNFLALLENLRKGDAVVKAKGKTIKFAKSNAVTVLPVYGKKFACNMSL